MSTSIAVEYLPIESLRPDPFNPRKISGEQLQTLMRSIEEFGFVDPVIVRRSDLAVIGGHQRLAAARRLRLKEVPVVLVDVSPEQAKLLNLALNRISGEWDESILVRLLSHLDELSLDLTVTGFAQDELAGLLASIESRERRSQPETLDLEFALLEAGVGGRVKAGDLWLLGPHRLYCGDASRAHDVDTLLGGAKADLAVTDPPYNVDYGSAKGTGKRRRAIKNDAMPLDEWRAFVRGWVANLLRSVGGALYIFMSCKEWPAVSGILEELGGHWSTTIIWAKDRFVLGRSDYQRQYEPIWYGWREGAGHDWHGGRDQGDTWRIDRPSASELHPTMKPLELIERALENSSRPGQIVLDLFLGSGTSLIAAERTRRVAYGMELDPIYCAVAIARWEAFTGERALHRGSSSRRSQ
jgi:DNA modification methylase